MTGANFIRGSVVRWNGLDRVTAVGSATQLQASIPAADIAAAGTARVTVYNPPPGGGTSGASTFTVNQLLLSSLSLSPSPVVGGTPSTGTVTLSGPAPSGGATLALTSSNPAVASVPTSVTVAGGAKTATFTVTTKRVKTSTSVTISAVYSGVNKQASLKVQH